MEPITTRSRGLAPRAKKPRERRIGLFGGSFDPVHAGHLRMAALARKKCGLDAVVFIPAKCPPHKRHKRLSPAQHRVIMLARAIRETPAFCVSRYELERPGVTYTYQTVRHFRRLFPRAKLFFIMGMDSFNELHTWKRVERILADCTLIVCERTPESSSDIRARRAAGRPLKGLVPAAVESYITGAGLYEH